MLFILSDKICDFTICVCFFKFSNLKLYRLTVYFGFSRMRFYFSCLLSCFFPRQSLTLLEYLLKTGDDRVLLKMKDNTYIVKALAEYRFVEKEGKDQVISLVST